MHIYAGDDGRGRNLKIGIITVAAVRVERSAYIA